MDSKAVAPSAGVGHVLGLLVNVARHVLVPSLRRCFFCIRSEPFCKSACMFACVADDGHAKLSCSKSCFFFGELFVVFGISSCSCHGPEHTAPLASRTFHLCWMASSGLPGEFGAVLARESAAARGDVISCVWVSNCVGRGLRLLSRCSLDLSEVSFSLITGAKDGSHRGFATGCFSRFGVVSLFGSSRSEDTSEIDPVFEFILVCFFLGFGWVGHEAPFSAISWFVNCSGVLPSLWVQKLLNFVNVPSLGDSFKDELLSFGCGLFF